MNIAVIGAGVIGQLRARSVAGNSKTSMRAIAEADAAVRPRLNAFGVRVTGDYRELIDDRTIDAVILSTPVHLHEEMALAAFGAGKHVFCEKPLSNSVESCRRILDASRAAGRALAVGFNHRYYPAVTFVKQAIGEGRIGDLDHVRVFGGHDGLNNFRADWMYKDVSGGGAMMDVGIHMTDLTRFVVGEVHQVYGVASNRVWNVPGSEDNALAIFKSDTGVPVFYQATWNEWKGYRFFLEAYGNLGMVRGYYAPMFNLLVTHDRPGAARKRTMKFYPEIIVREKLKGWQSTALLSFQEELGDFLAMIEGRPVRLADGWSGLRAVEIAQAVYRSTATDAPVVLSRP
jgi:predicted dehydrogenase